MAETTDATEAAAMPVVEWRARLTGEAFDLEDFPLWTEGCDYTVRQIDGAYFLCLPVTLVGADPGIVMDLLIQYEEQLNGIGNLLQGSYQPIRVEHGLLGHDAQGAPVSRSMRAGGVALRMKVGMIAANGGGAAGLDSRHGAAKVFIAAAEHMDLAGSALTMLSRVNLTWPELYVLAEIVQHASNSTQVEKGWIGAGELVRFKRTCGSFEILGVDARHGPQPHQAPTQPMSLNTASGLIRKMTKSWLEEVGAASSPSPGP